MVQSQLKHDTQNSAKNAQHDFSDITKTLHKHRIDKSIVLDDDFVRLPKTVPVLLVSREGEAIVLC